MIWSHEIINYLAGNKFNTDIIDCKDIENILLTNKINRFDKDPLNNCINNFYFTNMGHFKCL